MEILMVIDNNNSNFKESKSNGWLILGTTCDLNSNNTIDLKTLKLNSIILKFNDWY